VVQALGADFELEARNLEQSVGSPPPCICLPERRHNPTWRLGLARVREDRSGAAPDRSPTSSHVPKPMARPGSSASYIRASVNVCERATVVTWLVNSTSRTSMAQSMMSTPTCVTARTFIDSRLMVAASSIAIASGAAITAPAGVRRSARSSSRLSACVLSIARGRDLKYA